MLAALRILLCGDSGRDVVESVVDYGTVTIAAASAGSLPARLLLGIIDPAMLSATTIECGNSRSRQRRRGNTRLRNRWLRADPMAKVDFVMLTSNTLLHIEEIRCNMMITKQRAGSARRLAVAGE